MDIKEYRSSFMSVVSARLSVVKDKLSPGDTKFEWKDWLRVGLTVAIVGFAIVDLIVVSKGTITDKDYKKNVTQFSYHAYDFNNNGAIHGPFLGKVRLAGSIAVTTTLEDNNMKQSICDKVGIVVINNSTYEPIPHLMDKCKMMRTPDMFFGNVHSSWSVLGAQSIYNLVKHIASILIAFLVFSWVEDQILTHTKSPEGSDEKINYFRSHFRFMRSMTVIFVIIVFTINIAMDIKDDMHVVDSNHDNKVAIGSITTGVSFCLVSILIICLSHLDDPWTDAEAATPNVGEKPAPTVDTDTGDTGNVEFGSVDKPQNFDLAYNFAQQSRQFRGPKQVPFGVFNFQAFENDAVWSNPSKLIPYELESKHYKKVQTIYRNIHVSYLMLLLFPLVSILALARAHMFNNTKIVDVHVQLIFFSSIFVAVLDIMQSRVSSVLASFSEANSKDTPIGKIKIFVVLAFCLAKLFVFMPAYQLTVRYYIQTGTVEFGLVLIQLLAFLVLSALDLVYIAGLVGTLTDVMMVGVRQLGFCAYLFGLTWSIYWI